jgi:hypothetical protein
LGCVRFMQLSSSSKTTIQKKNSSFGVCDVYVTLIIIKDCNTKKSIILWGLWGLCTTLIIKDCNTKKSVILWGLWGLCKGG